jgi:hypothetical protein
MGIKVIGISSSINELTKTINKSIETELRTRALKALSDVKLQTPVDLGIARNSWYIGYTEKYINAKETPTSITILAPKNKPTKIVVTNGVEYIEFLNNGHSKQAPTKFIESAFYKYFDDVIVETIKN